MAGLADFMTPDDRLLALAQGLGGFSGGMGGASPVPIGLAGRLAGGLAGLSQAAMTGLNSAVGLRQVGLQFEEAEAEKKRKAALANIPGLANWTPEQQQVFRMIADADPQAAMSLLGGQTFPEPEKAETFKPNVENIITGNQQQSGYLDPTGRWVPLGEAGARFAPQQPDQPKSLDERDDLTLRTGDPASVQYAQAFYRQFMTPKMVQTETGIVPVLPPVPPGIRPPAGLPAGQGAGQGMAIPGTEKPLTEVQGAAAGFADRMTKAEAEIDRVVDAGLDPASTLEHGRAGVPGVGNFLASTEFQQYRQAQEDWVRAKLRKESGAVIAEEEMAREITTYFPQPGDQAEVIEQKRRARETATQALIRQAGRTYAAPAAANTGPQLGEPTAINPLTGETLVLRNGQWVTP